MEKWVIAFVATLLLTVGIGLSILLVWLISELLEFLNVKNLYTVKRIIVWVFWLVVYMVLMTMMFYILVP